MKVDLPLKSFSFVKVAVGAFYLLLSVLAPVIAFYSFFIALAVGRAHGVGAWIGMWRAKRITWKYVTWVAAISMIVSYWGMQMISTEYLIFFTTFLFAFHFFYDEYELQEQKLVFSNFFAGLTPLVIVWAHLINAYYKLGISITTLALLTVVLLLVEAIYTTEINWFFIQSKIHTLFIWAAILTGLPIQHISGLLLTFHYFFWFVYPVYKLHKYKPDERDGLVMILILITLSSLYFAITKNNYSLEAYTVAVKVFMVGTIIHILATAPFAELLGLKTSSHIQK